MPTGPSSSTEPYIVPLAPNVTLTSLITVGDTLPGSTTGIFAGIADGIGAFDNGDGTVTVIVNHELRDTQGVVRDHGSIGSFIDTLIVDKATLAVLGGDDTIKQVYLWDDANDQYLADTTAFNRFCSGDLAEGTAFYNAETGLGSEVRIYLTGEEAGSEGRAVATLVSGGEIGNAYELPFLGNLAFENVVANPHAQDKTIVALTDDGSNGQVYIYVGEKQATGSEIEKAGLSGGSFYGIKVQGIADETDATPVSGTFTLNEIGPDGDVSNMTGAQIDAESEAEDVTSFLRPEDSAWDPDSPNTLYFTTTNSFDGNSRLYKATFTDIAHPELGGTIEAVLDGSEGHHMFDNLTVGNGKVILQEDPGNQSYLAQSYEYDIATDTLTPIYSFDPAQFTPGEPGFITQDEESSGMIDVTSIFGGEHTRTYLLDAQVHASTGDPNTVEMGQLLLMQIEDPIFGGNGKDVLVGNERNNVIDGGNGKDVLVGLEGDDCLTGGHGKDWFVFDNTAETGADTIKDLGKGDLILLTEKLDGDKVIGLDGSTLDLFGSSTVEIDGYTSLKFDGTVQYDGQTYFAYEGAGMIA